MQQAPTHRERTSLREGRQVTFPNPVAGDRLLPRSVSSRRGPTADVRETAPTGTSATRSRSELTRPARSRLRGAAAFQMRRPLLALQPAPKPVLLDVDAYAVQQAQRKGAPWSQADQVPDRAPN